MGDGLASVLHRLPPPARSAFAALGGLYTRRRRVVADRAAAAAAAAERDTWPAERWQAWSEERLAELLHRAATRVPYYRAYWDRRRRVGDRTSWERLHNWPVLEPDELRASAARLVADDADARRMVRVHAGGSAGRPLTLWRSRRTLDQFAALADTRVGGWHGLAPETPWARITGRIVTPAARRRPPFWVWNRTLRQLALSGYHLAPDLAADYLDALARYRIGCLVGRPAALAALAREAVRLGCRDVALAAAVTTGRPADAEERRLITTAFGCTVIDAWGTAELAAHAGRCAAGALHLWPEVGRLEVLGPGGEPVAAGEAGELVGTGLLSSDMPLVRYRTGDRGRLAPDAARCDCGRALPILAAVDAQPADTLLTPDGRHIVALGSVFHGLPVREMQVVQEAPDRLLVRVAPGVGYGAGIGRVITTRLLDRMGDVAVRVATVATVPRTPDGRVQAVVCRLSAAEREDVLRRARGA